MFRSVLLAVPLLLATVVTVLPLPLEARPAGGVGPTLEEDGGPPGGASHLTAVRQKRRAAGDADRHAALHSKAEVVTGEEQQRFRRNSHLRLADDDGEEKRAFQPWGGKRQAEIPEATWDALGDDLDEEAQAGIETRSFNPWGGKRSSGDKRKFQPWGGKRGDDLKRKFQPWGGKRQVVDVEDLKRRFNPWAGKRAMDTENEDDDMLTEFDGDNDDDDSAADDMEKRAFQPWGGKRSAFQPWGGKRSAFQPWGGKRASFQPWGGKRASFQPWGGKRASFQPWGGKRASFQPWGGKRASFQPWGGKRASFQPWGGKRGFQPWGGKRSTNELEEVQTFGEEDKRQAFQRSTDNELEMHRLYQDGEPQGMERN